MKKTVSLFLAALMLLSCLSACKPGVPENESRDESNAESIAESEDSCSSVYPLELTDQAGRRVIIGKKPERLVSGYYISTSAVIALGLSGLLVGIEAKADTRPLYALAAPELLSLPDTGTAKQFNLEGCLAMEPDLVILPLKLMSAAETLEEFGIPVLLVNPESQELCEEMTELIAAACDVKPRAEKLKTGLDALRALLSGLEESERPSVYLAGNASYLNAAGSRMYQADLIRLAGGRNAAEELGDLYWSEISYEQLLAFDPDVIVLASDAAYSAADILADPALTSLSAVRNGSIYAMPGTVEAWDSPVPGGILGALWLASVLHPQVVSPADFERLVGDFYRDFYGFEVSLEE